MKIFNKKINIGIDINEIFRSKWEKFDLEYVKEFGEDGVPFNDPYVYDYFNNYKWNDIVEEIKELKEPEDMPKNINPIDYNVDKTTNEVPADFFIFKPIKKEKLKAKEVYNRFMYEDYCFEIHGAATTMYSNLSLDINNFYLKYNKNVDFTILSIENRFSIPPTLFFLSKMSSRFKNYRFVENSKDLWNNVDILITTDPEILKTKKPLFKKLIKVRRPYNDNIKSNNHDLEIIQLVDLIDNKQFEKIINYKK